MSMEASSYVGVLRVFEVLHIHLDNANAGAAVVQFLVMDESEKA